MTNTDQGSQITVPPSLGQHAFATVDQDNGDICGRGARKHIARELLMARCIGHDELALVGRKETIRHIDGDTLLAFGRKPIHQQGEIQVAALRADLL
ncbi:hypothetical protein D3C87_1323370 [compost metagenome]